ncbi:hypothetical protein IE077_001970 [Cardiosporidium cionae]|uniref:Kinetochore protein SPC25 n=1 Tax=Cardiosporidium cionae TaxID=476202 RepID=A0ABQ7JBV5_9APIC|nr:hypothetical protein IE077_001970 [Cardiosporidium cionae]|eukprot:KAF8821487.1 hypothetical protein IE077_001970 [Cardiosporidium cionae]
MDLNGVEDLMGHTVALISERDSERIHSSLETIGKTKDKIYKISQEIEEINHKVRTAKKGIEANEILITGSASLDKEQQDILDALPKDISQINRQIEEEQTKLQALRKEYRAIYDHSRHTLEDWEKRLEQYTISLGLEVVSEVKDNGDPLQKVIFRYINPADIQKEYFFTFQIVKDRYAGVECQPFVAVFHELLDYVNQGKLTMAGVLRIMRHKFKNIASTTSSSS